MDEKKIKRLFYWNDTLPGYKDEGPRLKVGDKIRLPLPNFPEMKVSRISFEDDKEQRIWL